ncbi:PDDEXK-like family protein [Prevotella intermedia]|uniref:PDDEXK-like family protein n=1 Tax=Prevotella intermedia TaxID=28131 RepID=UPI00077E0410|nr:PD-(D/E)XK nuclease family protein [Prevotella intermedia]
MDRINNLLNQISIIEKKNTEILDATGERFNMFRICGVNHYENTHSAILTEFLNPKGTHGLKSKLLECFIKTLGENFTINGFNCENARIYTEYSTSEGRIDILIEDEKRKKAIIIENKIYANDQLNQLKRYDSYAKNKYPKGNYQILYLTLNGKEATEQSGKGVSYLTISYEENIINWLEKCVAIASRFPIVRETIIQYINHLKELTHQDMNNKNKEEITEVLSKIENLKAAKIIYQNYLATFDSIIKKHFNPKMEEFAKQEGLEYIYENSEELYVRFYLTNPLWQEKCWIGFTFETSKYYYGLCNDPNKYKISDENIKKIHEQLNKLGIYSFLENEWWPFYKYIPNLTLDNWENDIINSDNFLNDRIDKTKKILEVMKTIEL